MHRLVEYCECAAARLRPFGFGNAIAREQFVRKALAVGVYQNGAVAADVSDSSVAVVCSTVGCT